MADGDLPLSPLRKSNMSSPSLPYDPPTVPIGRKLRSGGKSVRLYEKVMDN